MPLQILTAVLVQKLVLNSIFYRIEELQTLINKAEHTGSQHTDSMFNQMSTKFLKTAWI